MKSGGILWRESFCCSGYQPVFNIFSLFGKNHKELICAIFFFWCSRDFVDLFLAKGLTPLLQVTHCPCWLVIPHLWSRGGWDDSSWPLAWQLWYPGNWEYHFTDFRLTDGFPGGHVRHSISSTGSWLNLYPKFPLPLFEDGFFRRLPKSDLGCWDLACYRGIFNSSSRILYILILSPLYPKPPHYIIFTPRCG